MLANKDKKQDLVEHCRAVGLLAESMASYLGLSDKLKDYAKWAGTFHDIGKVLSGFQNFITSSELDESVTDFPFHHEVSWAFVALKMSQPHTLNAIYWHHGRPLQDDFGYYTDRDEILQKVSIKDMQRLEKVWLKLSQNFKCGEPLEECPVPDMFVRDGSGRKLTNAEYLSVRSCVVSADRHISHCFESDLSGMNPEKEINIILNGGIKQGSVECPQDYDLERFNLQKDCIKNIDSPTTIIRAPAGFGKTLIGILWGLSRGRQIIWVCPRNIVAESVYENILEELKKFNLNCSIELYLTGNRISSNISENDGTEFNTDIIVTNIDNILSPMVNNKIGGRLFQVFGSDVILDEFHELVSDAPMFAALITYMRARHRVANSCHTLLLSATPTNMHIMWDCDNRITQQLPNETSHYKPVHLIPYEIRISKSAELCRGGTLTIHNSIRNAQETYENGNYDLLLHSKYTREDRRINEEKFKKLFKKGGTGVQDGKNVSAAPVVQAAMDISFLDLIESVCSPEATLQRIGRINRWGELTGSRIVFLDIADKSESAAIKTVYDSDLRKTWMEYLTASIQGRAFITLSELYDIYNSFYAKHGEKTQNFLRGMYKKGLEGTIRCPQLGLISYYPKRLPEVEPDPILKGHRNLRQPLGSYFFTVQKRGTSEWVPADEEGNPPFSEGPELYREYLKEERASALLSSKMDRCLKGLVKAGYSTYKKLLKKGFKKDIDKWFKRARDPETPLPDISREYDSVLGLVKRN